MICDALIPYPFFSYDMGDDNGTDYPIYNLYNDCQEPQAALQWLHWGINLLSL